LPKVVFLVYNYLPNEISPEQWISRIGAQVKVMQELGKKWSVFFVGHIGYQGSLVSNNIQYFFLPGSHRTKYFPFRTHLFIKRLKPDVVIIFGMHSQIQIIQLQFFVGRDTKIIEQYEADKPFSGIKLILQQLADRRINYYFFSAKEDARPWVNTGNILNFNKCKEVYVGAPKFDIQNKEESKHKISMYGNSNYLWVGRLNDNKDPLTVLNAFAKYLKINPFARLHMIYHTADMLPQIRELVATHAISYAVLLHGFIQHDELKYWYSAAEFFISASLREGGSYALIEAMACGCIPIVSAIPSSLVAIQYGEVGLYFEPGNVNELVKILLVTNTMNKALWSARVREHFSTHYSAAIIARKLIDLLS